MSPRFLISRQSHTGVNFNASPVVNVFYMWLEASSSLPSLLEPFLALSMWETRHTKREPGCLTEHNWDFQRVPTSCKVGGLAVPSEAEGAGCSFQDFALVLFLGGDAPWVGFDCFFPSSRRILLSGDPGPANESRKGS